MATPWNSETEEETVYMYLGMQCYRAMNCDATPLECLTWGWVLKHFYRV